MATEKNPDKLMAYMVQKMKERGEPLPNCCILCGRDPSFLALFIPKNPEAWGGKKDVPRLLLYALCERCEKMPNKAVAVENKITSEGRFN